jgi:uncharacterized protein YndB with AHSA1/START domain
MTAPTDPKDWRDDELTIVRVFDAPAALVFRIWESREHMMQWWGPEGFTCTHLELDFRPGGKWRVRTVSEEWGESWAGGVFQVIERNKRIVTTSAWEEGYGETDETILTVTFEEKGGRTIQTLHQAGHRTTFSRDRHVPGWESLINDEQRYAEALARQAPT